MRASIQSRGASVVVGIRPVLVEKKAQRLAERLAAQHVEEGPGLRRAPTLGVYLTKHWLPTTELALRPSNFDGCRRNIGLPVLPAVGRVPLCHVRAEHLESPRWARDAHVTECQASSGEMIVPAKKAGLASV
jgi:hypothetical protein